MPSETIPFCSVANRRTRAASAWSREDVCKLRELAQNGTPLQLISSILRRTESAVRNKAGMHGISLQMSASKARDSETIPSDGDIGLLRRVSGR